MNPLHGRDHLSGPTASLLILPPNDPKQHQPQNSRPVARPADADVASVLTASHSQSQTPRAAPFPSAPERPPRPRRKLARPQGPPHPRKTDRLRNHPPRDPCLMLSMLYIHPRVLNQRSFCPSIRAVSQQTGGPASEAAGHCFWPSASIYLLAAISLAILSAFSTTSLMSPTM
jgi:hypothetical protein